MASDTTVGEPADQVGRLTNAGAVPAGWLPAFAQAPRHLFVPDVIWVGKANPLTRVDLHTDPDGWRRAVEADQALVTQLDDGSPPTDVPPDWTSSTSTPSVMTVMLDRLDVAEGMRVLEIGTGTGWNAGLLAARLGEDNVTTIEIDPVLADRARAALRTAGLNPTVITGDGEAGWAPGAPYDRVIVTAAAHHIPRAWVEQTRPGGRIIVPWRNTYTGRLVCLQVNDDRTATGQFDANVGFMWLRGQRPAWWTGRDGTETVTPLTLWPSKVFGNLAVGLHLPDCFTLFRRDPDGQTYHFQVHVRHQASGSWARVEVEPDRDVDYVFQGGPRKLWDEVAAAYAWWENAGRPVDSRFGLTVTPETQWTWLDSPDQAVPEPR